jgi:hypothetical protein
MLNFCYTLGLFLLVEQTGLNSKNGECLSVKIHKFGAKSLICLFKVYGTSCGFLVMQKFKVDSHNSFNFSNATKLMNCQLLIIHDMGSLKVG